MFEISDLFPSIDASAPGFENNFESNVKLLFLLAVYGYILFVGSNLIADGSESLSLVLSPGLVGGLILPVMGAVPDGAIVLFSGLGPDAASQLSVGVGTLAGSTIMLLTVPWGLCGIMGRVNMLPGGKADYRGKPKLTNGWSLTRTGVSTTWEVPRNAKIMMATGLAYFIIQGPALKLHKEGQQHYWALAGLLVTLLLFIAYSAYMVTSANAAEQQQNKIDALRKEAFKNKTLSIATYIGLELQAQGGADGAAATSRLLSGDVKAADALMQSDQLRGVLRGIFIKWDLDGSGAIDLQELRAAMGELGLPMTNRDLTALMSDMGGDDNLINFDEFVAIIGKWLTADPKALRRRRTEAHLSLQQAQQRIAEMGIDDDDDDDDGEEDEDEEMAGLSPGQIKARALGLMILGVAVVTFFSDPMVGVLSAAGTMWNIPAFYISFVVTPLVSNASEFITSIAFAKKRTRGTITVTYSALLGAATMNNTFCLAIFLLIIFMKKLVWDFTSEVLSIFLVELAMLGLCWSPHFPTWKNYVILSLFPLSIVFIWVLDNVAGLK
jgi:Ca2+/Na+ antiporter